MQRGAEARDQPCQTKVLYDHRIGPRLGDRGHKPHRLGQFIREHQCVECHIAPHVMAVKVSHHLRQFLLCEIGGAMAGVEVGKPEVDRVSPIGNSRAHRLPITGGRE